MPAVKASERPTIDGDISDAVWASAPKASGFVDRITGQPAPDDTAVWLLYDSENLYLAFHAFDSDPSSITARETRRDAQMGYRARIRNHGHSCFLCEIVIRSQFHTTYEPEA
jgi:hypothetical protein